MRLGTFYIKTKDIKRSVRFYGKLLQEEPLFRNGDRWVQFGNFIALYDPSYDKELIGDTASERFNRAYIDDFRRDVGERENNIIVINLVADDLNEEYKRLKELNIGSVSELMYVNVFMPYWYFNITDPDGNTIEITGKYDLK